MKNVNTYFLFWQCNFVNSLAVGGRGHGIRNERQNNNQVISFSRYLVYLICKFGDFYIFKYLFQFYAIKLKNKNKQILDGSWVEWNLKKIRFVLHKKHIGFTRYVTGYSLDYAIYCTGFRKYFFNKIEVHKEQIVVEFIVLL